MAEIALAGVRKAFGEVEVLSDVNLHISEGEFCVLVGPSGCGKSTLLRLIAGLEELQAGTIEIGGRVVNDLRPRDRDVAMVFQSYALYPHMTVEKNLAFGLRMHRYDKAAIAERIGNVSRSLGMEMLLDRLPGQLSGGQRQRVAMGRAMVRDPGVFLFDEPLSNLDAKLRVQMRTEIRDLHQRIEATSVYVTHDQIEAMTMADRIVVMNGGRIEQAGAPLELFDDPANVFVATFLGAPAINLIPGTVEAADGRAAIRLSDGALVESAAASSATRGAAVLAAVRPHHLVRDDDAGPISAEVRVVEPTGVETFLFCEHLGQEIRCQTTRQANARVGERIGLKPAAEDVLLFDQSTGERLR